MCLTWLNIVPVFGYGYCQEVVPDKRWSLKTQEMSKHKWAADVSSYCRDLFKRLVPELKLKLNFLWPDYARKSVIVCHACSKKSVCVEAQQLLRVVCTYTYAVLHDNVCVQTVCVCNHLQVVHHHPFELIFGKRGLSHGPQHRQPHLQPAILTWARHSKLNSNKSLLFI